MRSPFATPQDAAWAARFFAGYPEAAAIWKDVVARAQAWGPVQVRATQSRVCLMARTRFAYCPQAHKAGTLFLRFHSPMPIDSDRARNDPMPDGRTSVRVRLERADDEAMEWLEQAYRLDVA